MRSDIVWKPQKWGITCGVTLPSTSVEPRLPNAVGPLSSAVIETLARGRPALHARPIDIPLCEADPYGLDLQLALYVCYELHYRGFAGVNASSPACSAACARLTGVRPQRARFA